MPNKENPPTDAAGEFTVAEYRNALAEAAAAANASKEVTVASYRKALAAQAKFCTLCGTTLTKLSKTDKLKTLKKDIVRRLAAAAGQCLACSIAIRGPMSLAHSHWVEMGERYKRCCGGFNHDRSHLYFHGKYFDDSYPLAKRTNRPLRRGPHVEVEHGVAFYRDYAQPYYLRDFDHYCDSQDYGDPVPYSSEKFWEEVEANFGKAAKAAWDSDLQTCRACGYHYDPTVEPCPCKGRE